MYIEKMLYNKWWGKDLEGGLYCPKQGTNLTKASALNLANIGGVFVVLFCGLIFAVLVAIAEFCFKLKARVLKILIIPCFSYSNLCK